MSFDLHQKRLEMAYSIYRVYCVTSGCGTRLTDAEAKVSPRCGKCLSKPETELCGVNQGRCGHDSEVFSLWWLAVIAAGGVAYLLWAWLSR